MKEPIFFPFYNIHSDLVKTAIGLTDNRSVELFFINAKIRITPIGKKKCVTYDDLMNATKPSPVVLRYEPKSQLSKRIDEIE